MYRWGFIANAKSKLVKWSCRRFLKFKLIYLVSFWGLVTGAEMEVSEISEFEFGKLLTQMSWSWRNWKREICSVSSNPVRIVFRAIWRCPISNFRVKFSSQWITNVEIEIHRGWKIKTCKISPYLIEKSCSWFSKSKYCNLMY